MNDRRRTLKRYLRRLIKRQLLREFLRTGTVLSDVNKQEYGELREWFRRCGIPSYYNEQTRKVVIL